MTVIRHTRPGDAEAVAALVRASWKQTYEPLMGAQKAVRSSGERDGPDVFRGELDRDGLVSFVAEQDDGAIVGHAMAHEADDGTFWLARLHVAPKYHRGGVAAELLIACIAASEGHPSLALEVVEGNDRAVAFYRKHGFEVTERKGACGGIEGVPTLVMRRPLPWA